MPIRRFLYQDTPNHTNEAVFGSELSKPAQRGSREASWEVWRSGGLEVWSPEKPGKTEEIKSTKCICPNEEHTEIVKTRRRLIGAASDEAISLAQVTPEDH